jgi:hypothetical protein
MMDSAAQASAWVGLAAGVLCLVVGSLILTRQHAVLRSVRIDGRRLGPAGLSCAAGMLLNAVPRLAGAPDDVVLVMSVLGLVPLAVAVTLLIRARSPRL